MRQFFTLAIITLAIYTQALAADDAAKKAKPAEPHPTKEGIEFFEKKIRPVLVAKCYKCHSAESEKVKGGLLLDTREGIRMGGATGHAVEPGDLKGSLLITAIRGEKKDSLMPPKEKLPAEVIADFEKWVLMGAPDPRDGKAKLAKKPDLAEGKNFWSFQPVKPVAVPQPKDAKWSTTEIDRFILKKLEEHQLKPVPDADQHSFIRRLYFDLIGLPPTPEQVAKVKASHTGQFLAKVLGTPAEQAARKAWAEEQREEFYYGSEGWSPEVAARIRAKSMVPRKQRKRRTAR
mgnify:CR=1 FL=1